MDCIAALTGLNLLGALVSTVPSKSVAVFERVYSASTETILMTPGDFLAPGLQVIAIHSRKNLTLRCAGETFEYFFWSLNRSTIDPDFAAPEEQNLPETIQDEPSIPADPLP